MAKHSLTARVRGRLRGVVLALPDAPRRWLVAALPGGLVGRATKGGATRDTAYFEELYTADADPYGFDRNPLEQLKFARLLDLCGDAPLGRVLELGCALGTFTERLAPRCDRLLAVDISPTAVDAAARRLAPHPGVTCAVANLPDELPEGPFDLVVVSDILYYWSTKEIRSAVRGVEAALAPGGALVAAHYVPDWGAIVSGDEGHDVLAATTTLRHELEGSAEFGEGRPYRLDRFVKA